MKTEIIPSNHPLAIQRACEVLLAGRLVAFPTDTLYGVAALVTNRRAIDQLYRVKGRENTKAIAVLIGDTTQLALVTGDMNDIARRLANAFWPGALTLVVPRNASLPENLSPTHTIGVRMPDHTFARELLKRCGPLATTSANSSGAPDSLNAGDVLSSIGGMIDLIVDGGSTPGALPSTVIDCTVDPPQILRQGVIRESSILQVISARLVS